MDKKNAINYINLNKENLRYDEVKKSKNSWDLPLFYHICNELDFDGYLAIKEREIFLDNKINQYFSGNPNGQLTTNVINMLIERHFEDTLSNVCNNIKNILDRCVADPKYALCVSPKLRELFSCLQQGKEYYSFSLAKKVADLCQDIEIEAKEKCVSYMYQITKKEENSFANELKSHIDDLRNIGKKYSSFDGVDLYDIDGENFTALIRVVYAKINIFENKTLNMMSNEIFEDYKKASDKTMPHICTSVVSNKRYNHYGNRIFSTIQQSYDSRKKGKPTPYVIFGYSPSKIISDNFMSANVGNANSSCNLTNRSQKSSDMIDFNSFMKSCYNAQNGLHNEIIFKNDRLNGIMSPSYIVAEDSVSPLDLAVAKRFGVPIVTINTLKLEKAGKDNYEKFLKKIEPRDYDYYNGQGLI